MQFKLIGALHINRLMRRLSQIAASLLVIGISLVSLVPPSLRPVTGTPHNFEHLAIFLLTGIAFAIGYPRRHFRQSIGLVIFSGLIEIMQLWVPGRHARLSDFIVDASAACIGVATSCVTERLVSTRPT